MVASTNGSSSPPVRKDELRNCQSPPKADRTLMNLDWLSNPSLPTITSYQRFFHSVNWSATSVGPISQWPRELKQVVRHMMADVKPVILYWGLEYAIIYNEAHVALVGSRHPDMLGMDAPAVFPDFWSYFAQVISEQRLTGQTASGEAEMLLMQRHGFLEETYFDWKLVPVIGDNGFLLGSYGSPSDRTFEVVGTRRMACVQRMSEKLPAARNFEDLFANVVSALETNENDVPMMLLYSLNDLASTQSSPQKSSLKYHLRRTLGVPTDHPLAKSPLNVQDDIEGFAPAVLQAVSKQEIVLVTSDDPRISELLLGVSWRGFQIPSSQFVVIPIIANGSVAAIFILALNPYQRYDDPYFNFLTAIAGVASSEISKLLLSEEVKRNTEAKDRAVENFKQSESKFAKFAQRSVAAVAVTDVNGKVLYANEAWYKFSGLDPGNLDYTNWIDSVHPDDAPILQKWWKQLLDEKQGGTFQFRSKFPFENGNMKSDFRTGLCACYADLNEFGEVETIMGITLDISEMKWMEEQLLQRTKEIEISEAKYRTFAELAPLGVCRTNAEGEVVFGNEHWYAIYDFAKDDVLDPQPWLPFIHEDDMQKAKDYFETVRSTSDPTMIELKLASEFSITEKGRVITNDAWILATGNTHFNAEGIPEYIDFWVVDISAQKMAAKILTDKMEEAVRLKTQQEHFIDMISHEIRNPLSAVLHCGEEILSAMQSCTVAMESMPVSAGSALKQLPLYEILTASITSAQEAANTVMYCVQHQKQIVDDVLTLSKLDSDLLVVSPVPVNPSALVRSSLKMFEPELKMTDIALSIIEDQSLNDLGVDFVLLDPNRFLQIVINLVTNAIKFTRTSAERRIEIQVSARQERPPISHNGIDYVSSQQLQRRATSPNIERTTFIGRQDELFLCFSVKDTGKGLTKNEKTLLFNRFAQASPRTHVEYGGSGLGLFISRQITQLLGGEIGVGGNPGIGSTFAFYVKTSKVTPPKVASRAVEPVFQLSRAMSSPEHKIHTTKIRKMPDGETALAVPTPLTTKQKVLVVEDNLVNQKVLCKQLRTRGFLVEASNHGKEALDALTRQSTQADAKSGSHFDIVLCDIEMPVMNGIECVKQIRKLEDDGMLDGHIPIIGVTANVRSKQVDAAIEAGMDGVTTKPYRIDDLIAHMDRLLPY